MAKPIPHKVTIEATADRYAIRIFDAGGIEIHTDESTRLGPGRMTSTRTEKERQEALSRIVMSRKLDDAIDTFVGFELCQALASLFDGDDDWDED